MTKKRCRHGGSWLIAGARFEWCYRCGAVRELTRTGPAEFVAATQWTRPTGQDGRNPWPMKRLESVPSTSGDK